jgi:bis(5'-nucleosyl)-tetraphosphatase (symmetrical)
MATWAIGDIQGCAAELDTLLERIAPGRDDRLWFVGDLVNRGPDSLAALRRVHALGEIAVVVLGNHDLHLLAVALGAQQPKRKDTLDAVLSAPDREPLLEWLRHRPLLHHDAALAHTLVHAGLPPAWDLDLAIAAAREVESALRGSDYRALFEVMYGDQPRRWSDGLLGDDRLRYSINALTRMRLLTPAGDLELDAKGAPGAHPELIPWFDHPEARWRDQTRVVSGHWSTLGVVGTDRYLHLDGGCVWGGELAAVRLEDGQRECLDCSGAQRPG